MNINDSKSLILKIGDLKTSDTSETFGEKMEVNGITYTPIENPRSDIYNPVGTHLASGDSGEGVSIKCGDTEVFLTFGANRLGSCAQSMAIGYFDGNKYFFIQEYYRDINPRNPLMSRRTIVECDSIHQKGPNDREKPVFYLINPDAVKELTPEEEVHIKTLMSKISTIERGLSMEALNMMRPRTRYSRRGNTIEGPEDR